MRTHLSRLLRISSLALTLLAAFVTGGVVPVAAQEEAATEVADEVETAVQTVDDEEDEGFDDWGLLGLLGLAGLAGLLRRPARAVVVDDRVGPTGTRRT